ncbi:MAG: hypothetical protein GH150_07450 [Hadesarchaea archaeon]|nr:hypothetical protein [Hadesarchaea archaeon]
MIRDLTAIDLFSGAGGTSLGLVQAGFNVLAALNLPNLVASTPRNRRNLRIAFLASSKWADARSGSVT